MSLFLMTFLIMILAFLGLALGVLLGRSPIKGSCGGLNQIAGIECACAKPCAARKRLLANNDQ